MKRVALKRNTPLKHGKAMARQRMKRKPAPHGFPEAVRMAVRRRSGGACEARSGVCTTRAGHFHHRKLRRSKDHTEANCLHVCSACHLLIHDRPLLSYVMGWLVRQHDDPTSVPVKRGDGPTLH